MKKLKSIILFSLLSTIGYAQHNSTGSTPLEIRRNNSGAESLKIGIGDRSGLLEYVQDYDEGSGTHDLSFNILSSINHFYSWKSNNNELFRINSAGNVGIGTPNPASKLDVFRNSGNETIATFRTNEGTINISAAGSSTENPTYINYISSRNASNSAYEDFAIKTGGGIGQFLVKTNGNIGIGTDQPNFRLDVNGDFGTSGSRFTVAQGIINQNSTIENWGSASNQGGLSFNYNGKSTPGGTSQAYFRDFAIYNGKGDIVGFFDGSNKSLGIGTTTTGSHKLAVEGSIGARGVKVEATGWSDFVFKNDYNLRTLEQVESFINKNNHLPEIPSEIEVIENGIDLGQMDSKLLQKIEELTLYMIEMNKEIKEVKAENDVLKNKLNLLEQK